MHHRGKAHASGLRSRGEQALAVVILVGYVLALQGSTVGHGWSLLVHLAGAQHAQRASPTPAVAPALDARRVSMGATGEDPAVARRDSPVPPLEDGHTHGGDHVHSNGHAHNAKADHHGSYHRHGATHHEATHHETHGTPREDASTHPHAHESQGRKRAFSDAPRRAKARDEWNAPHEHDGQTHTHGQKQSQRERLLLVLTLDKHCFFEGPPRLSPPPDRDTDFACPAVTPGQNVLSVETPPPRLLG